MTLTRQQREQLAESVSCTCDSSVDPEYWIKLWGEETRQDVLEFDDDLEANCAEFEIYLCPVCQWWGGAREESAGICSDCQLELEDA